jgi:hypothetical protein
LHVQALGLVVAYDMYCKVLEEGFAEFGFENKKDATTKKCFLDFHAFRDKLLQQGIKYNPEDCKYKGDRKMRVNTKRGKSTQKEGQKRGHGQRKKIVTPEGGADNKAHDAAPMGTLHQFKQEKKAQGRLCGDLCKFMVHKASITSSTHELKCKWCGKNCYTRCGVCKMPIQRKAISRGTSASQSSIMM